MQQHICDDVFEVGQAQFDVRVAGFQPLRQHENLLAVRDKDFQRRLKPEQAFLNRPGLFERADLILKLREQFCASAFQHGRGFRERVAQQVNVGKNRVEFSG